MRFWLKCLVLLAAVPLLGCGSDAQQVTPPEVTAKEAVIKALEGLVESGQGGSEMGAALQEVDKLHSVDPELTKEIVDELTKMMSGTTQVDIKVKAQELLDKVKALPAEGAK
jgi:DNA-directed RNA polymerase subunit F